MNARSSISYKMTQTVVLLTLFFGLIIGSVQVAWDYQKSLEELESRVDNLLRSIENAAVKAVYTFDTDLAGEVASGLFEFPPVSSVRIIDENANVMTTMLRYPGDLPYGLISKFLYEEKYVREIPLYIRRLNSSPIGTLIMEVSPHETIKSFLERSLTILTAAVLQSFFISLLLLLAFHRTITSPLQYLAQDFTKINPEMPERSELSLNPKLANTEFEEVTSAGNNMLRVIGSHLRARDTAEKELMRQKNETERYLKIAEAIILQLDRNGKILMINQRGLDVLGYEKHEVIGANWFRLAIPKTDHENIRNIFSDLFEKKKPQSSMITSSYYENEVITKTGRIRRVFWHNAVEKNKRGEITGILSSGQDITARVEAEDALKATEGSLRTIIEATSEGFAIVQLDSLLFTDVNSSLHELLGYSRDEMINSLITDFINPHDIPLVRENLKLSDETPHRTYEIRLRRRDGSDVPVEINASSLPDTPDTSAKSVAFITDITRRRAAEENRRALEQQLRQSQKMETIGTLAGGIAHDFNNILTPILGYSSLLLNRIPEDDPNHSRIQNIATSANRAADMIKQILTFSKKSEGELVSSYLSPVIKEAVDLIQTTTPSHIEVVGKIEETCPPAVADSTQIQQLVLNLCTNATHAMSQDGGKLIIEMDTTFVSEDDVSIHPNLIVGPYIQILVQDTGHGMDEETLSRIFDPFFTTKKSGEGTGLGLAMVHGIVQNHNGAIFVESQIGEGSTFKVLIPIADTAVKESVQSNDITYGDNQLILVVDDEPLNTDFISELLEAASYKYVCYNDSLRALDAFMENPDKFDVILTDQTMPKLAGDQLVRAVREIRANIPIIMMSGYDQIVSMENAAAFGVDTYLQKPVSITALTHAISELIAENSRLKLH